MLSIIIATELMSSLGWNT